MLVYTADKRQFVEHVNRNEIDVRILDQMMKQGLGRVGRAEIASWRDSMQYMKNILATDDIPDDTGVAIEYAIPQTSKRIDFILTGRNPDNIDTAVIVELKQWEKASSTPRDAVVETFLGGAQREVTHPSYQAWTYAALLEDFNEAVETGDIRLRPCAYLHNSTRNTCSRPLPFSSTTRASCAASYSSMSGKATGTRSSTGSRTGASGRRSR